MSLDVHISEPDEFNCQELHSSLKEVAHSLGIEDFVYHVDCISGNKISYIANVFRVEIKGTDSEDVKLSVIVKTLVNTERQALFHGLHKREVLAYTKVISKFIDIQKDLSEEDKLKLSKCLYSRTEQSNEVIVLEDLKTNGFDTDDKAQKFKCQDFNEVSSVISELAKFHALSFIFENQEPDKFEKLKSEFNDIVFQSHFLNKSKLKDYFYDSFDTSLKCVTDSDASQKLERIQEDILDLLRMYLKPGKTNVLCHGDCWINNVLLKTEANKPTKVCFIDFQAMRYANPVTDLIYLLYICTDSIFRSEHLNSLKEIYHNSLESFLKLFEIDVNSVYSWEEFESDVEEFLPFGLLIAMIELRIVTLTPDDEAILKGSKLISNEDNLTVPGEITLFNHRVNDAVSEAVTNGALDKLLRKMYGD